MFDTLEINGTFYSLTTPHACREWYQAAPRGFVYAVKGSRFITHNKKLADVDGALANFFASGILELREKLGLILWQLPERSRLDAGRVDRFLGMLPRDTDAARRLARKHDNRVERAGYGDDANHRMRHVFEPRHESFLRPEKGSRHGTPAPSPTSRRGSQISSHLLARSGTSICTSTTRRAAKLRRRPWH